MDKIIERIAWLMTHYGLSKAQFARKIDFQSSALSHIFSGRNKPSLSMVSAIARHFPQVNMDWLIAGEGEALKSTASDQSEIFLEMNMPEKVDDSTLESDKSPLSGPQPTRRQASQEQINRAARKVIILYSKNKAQVFDVEGEQD